MKTILDAMRFATERTTLQEIMQRFGLEPILANYEQSGGLRSFRDYILGTQMKLSPQMSPRLFALLDEVRKALQYEEPVDLFVAADASINALAVYSLDETPHIVSLTSALVERMGDEELRFVLGHEIGHIHFQHYRARLAAQAIGEDEKGESRMPSLLRRRLDSWNRLAELSADRSGFAATDGQMESIVSAFFKIASGLGPEHLKFDISAFLNQLDELKQLNRRESICGFSHPVTPIRVRALQLFREVGGASAASSALNVVDGEVTQLAALMDYEATEPMEVHGRDFVLAGGLLVANADGNGISEEEQHALLEMLLPVTANPDAAIARVTSAEQARQMLRVSGEWLKQNAGEERFTVFRYLAHIAAVDGALQGKEEGFLIEAAGILGIPEKVAKNQLYEILARYLQERQSERMPIHNLR